MNMRRGWCLLLLTLAACPKRDESIVDRGAPAELHGRVFAQKVADLHLASPTGPVVGQIHPGAVVEVKKEDATHVRVTLPDAWWKSKQDDLWVYADNDAFTTTFVAREPFVLRAGKLVREVPPTKLVPSKEASEAFASTICGDVRVLSPNDVGPANVAQVHGGVELVGWVKDVELLRRGSERCSTRIVVKESDKLVLHGGTTEADREEVKAIPAGFVTADAKETDGGVDAFAEYAAAHKSVFWLVQRDKEPLSCQEWKLTSLADKSEGLLKTKPLTIEGKKTAFASFTSLYTPAKAELLLFGPRYHAEPLDKNPKAAPLGGYKCGTSYSFVGAKPGFFRFSGFGAGPTPVAWHPDDEEHWYTTAETCEAARAKADAQLRADPNVTPPGGVHYDCSSHEK